MPLAGTGDLLGLELIAASDAVTSSFLRSLSDGSGGTRAATEAEQKQFRIDTFKALGNTIVAHVVANAIVVGSATGVASGGQVAPVAGKVL
jgi:hypothetical protein